MKIARGIKHVLKGERLSLDEGVNFSQFEELIYLAGTNLHYRVRAGKGYFWANEKEFDIPAQRVREWFKEGNNEFYETQFFGRHQVYGRVGRDTHYIDCYLWLRRGNTSMVPPKGCKTNEGTIYFEVPAKTE